MEVLINSQVAKVHIDLSNHVTFRYTIKRVMLIGGVSISGFNVLIATWMRLHEFI